MGHTMQASTAQLVALTAHGNAALRSASAGEAEGFYPGNSSFKHCEYVRFARRPPNGEAGDGGEYAETPLAWLEQLRRDGTLGLRLILAPTSHPTSHPSSDGHAVAAGMLAGSVAGANGWMIEAVGAAHSDLWLARWEIGDRRRADQRIWRVMYAPVAIGQAQQRHTHLDLARIKAQLQKALQDIASFASAQGLEGFAKAFESGLAQLHAHEPDLQSLYHPDLLPQPMPGMDQAQAQLQGQLLGAVQAAWVFGGMGSWNDQRVDRAQLAQHEALSQTLYRLLTLAIVAVANANAPIKSDAPAPWWRRWL